MKAWTAHLARFSPAAALIMLWAIAADAFHVSSFLLPRPEAVLLRLARGLGSGEFLPHIAATGGAALMGFAIGSFAAVLAGILIAESRWADYCLHLPLTGLQSMPKVAVSPMLAMWLGFGTASMTAMAAITCFFAVFANTLSGLRSSDKHLVDLYRAYSATRLRILWDVKLPAAAVGIFAGLQIAVVLALIGTVVMEFLIASRGLGFLIMDASSTLDSAQAYAAIVLLGLLGASATSVVAYIGKACVFWNRGPMAASGGSK